MTTPLTAADSGNQHSAVTFLASTTEAPLEPEVRMASTAGAVSLSRGLSTPRRRAAEPLLPPHAEAHPAPPLAADDVEVLSGDILEPEEEADAFTGANDEDDPWWETLNRARPLAPRRMSLVHRLRTMTSLVMPFGLRERTVPTGTWRTRALMLAGLGVLVALTAIASVTAFGLASRLANTASQLSIGPSAPTPPNGVVIQPLNGGGKPTPAVPQYLIGAWVSDSAPASGSVRVFVRVTRHDRVSNSDTPAGGVPVRLTVQFHGSSVGYGPVSTNSYGLASFAVAYGSGYSGYDPVFVNANASVSGQTLTAQTSFAPR